MESSWIILDQYSPTGIECEYALIFSYFRLVNEYYV